MLSESAWNVFQTHRHDLQNYLQLVKAYLQLGRKEQALTAVDDCAAWLGSLSRVQNQLPVEAEDVFWVVVSCPHLRVEMVDFSPEAIDTGSLCECFQWLEQKTVEHNIKYIQVSVSGTAGNKALENVLVSGPSAFEVCWNVQVEGAGVTDWLREALTDDVHWQRTVRIVT